MKTYIKKFIPYILLTGLTLAILLLPLEPGDFFGSEGDWYSQHVGVADNIRQMMLEAGRLIPQFSAAGGGSNMFDYAYYGLLRPDVLISCLFPEVPIKYFIAGYALLCVVASVNLCYYWLLRKEISGFAATAAVVMMASSTALFHAHHQIMFVNYMPFLIIALMGIDRLTEKGKVLLLITGLFLIYINSYFYAFSCLVVCLLYYLHGMRERRDERVKLTAKAAAAVILSIGLAAVLLIPTAIDILSTHKDAGKFVEQPMNFIRPFEGLLFNPYGCGMTIIALVCLLWALKNRETRFLSAAVLIATSVPAVWLVLNGFLYPRAKILIPFIPLIAYVSAEALQDICRNRPKYKLAVCLLLIIPICISLTAHNAEDFVKSEDNRQNRFSKAEINMFADDKLYRFDYLANSFVNSNMIADGSLYKTAMYSSVSNELYGDFYYNTMRNPIGFRNRVALMPNQNPYFNYFMGIRYILVRENQVPSGYEVISRRDGYALAENPEVLPICFGTSQLLSEKDFYKLEFPETLEALTTRAVVSADTTAEFHSHMESRPKYLATHNGITIIEFLVNNPTGDEVTIDIGGMRNKLSGDSAPYPNQNHRFTYIKKEMPEVLTEKTNGKFERSYERFWTMDSKYLQHEGVSIPTLDKEAGSDGKTMFSGSIEMQGDGYFITSFPYKKGYEIFVDGENVEPEIVNTAFMGFPIKKGFHEVNIKFIAPGFIAGRAVSIVSVLIICLWIILRKIRERKNT